ncbi:MAG: hypothetical protein ACE5HP_01665 [Gemmatimonadota bacterium]
MRGKAQLGGGGAVREVVAVLGLSLLGSLFLWELLTMAWVPVARDMQMFFIPQLHLLWSALQESRIPLWTPFYGTGAPLMANFQSGVFYPPHWLFAVLGFFPAFNLLVVLHFILGGVGMYAFARRTRLSPFGSAVAAVSFMLGGYFASLLNLLNALQAAAWVPLVGYFLLRLAEERSRAAFLGLVATATLGFLAGEPQTFVIGVLLVGAFVGLRLLDARPTRAAAWRLLLLLGLAVLAVVGLSLVQLLPTAEMLAHSSRGTGLTYEEATGFSIDPLRLLHLVFPPDYSDPVYRFGVRSQIGTTDPWLFSIYLGAVPLGLGLFAWREAGIRREALFWTGAMVAGVLLGLGDHLPLYRWCFELVPGFAAFRFPEKFFLATGVGTAMLAGRGLDSLRVRGAGRRFAASALLLLAVGLGVKLAWLTGKEAFYTFARSRVPTQNFVWNFDFTWLVWGRHLDILLALTTVGVAAIWLHRRGRLAPQRLAALLLLLVTGDLFLAHRGLNPVVERAFYEREPLLARYLPMEELRLTYRYRATPFDELSGIVRIQPRVALQAQKWLWQQTMAPNTSQYRRILAPDTWDAIKLRRYVDQHEIYRVLPDAERRWRLLRLTSVKYAYHRAWLAAEGYRAAVVLDSVPGYLYEVRDPLPRAYVVPRGTFYRDEVEALNAALDAGRDPEREVALVGSPELARNASERAEAWSARARGQAEIVSDSGEVIRVRLSVPGAGYLVLTDSYYPGWSAVVDGEERPVYRANFFFRAVPVGPGDRELVFRYRSRPYEIGRWLSLAAGLTLLGGLGLSRRRRRRFGPSGE